MGRIIPICEISNQGGVARRPLRIPPFLQCARVARPVEAPTAVDVIGRHHAVGNDEHVARVYGERRRNFTGQHFWARGYFVSTDGRDEAVVRDYYHSRQPDRARARGVSTLSGRGLPQATESVGYADSGRISRRRESLSAGGGRTPPAQTGRTAENRSMLKMPRIKRFNPGRLKIDHVSSHDGQTVGHKAVAAIKGRSIPSSSLSSAAATPSQWTAPRSPAGSRRTPPRIPTTRRRPAPPR